MDDNQLKLLMDSYREQISLNTKLLERQERFITRLDESTQRLIEAINNQTHGFYDTLSKSVSELSSSITKDHAGITLRIYVALGGMISIMITLLSIWMIK